MQPYQFAAILEALPKLTPQQMLKLEQTVRQEHYKHQVGLLLETHAKETPCCPHCHHQYPIRYGTARGLQRYRCNSCGRTFTQPSGTPMSGLHQRQQWPAYAQALHERQTLGEAAAACGIHRNTALRWRHRFLAQLSNTRPEQLSGIIEADITFFRRPFKGQHHLTRAAYRYVPKADKPVASYEQVRVLVARDRNRQTLMVALPRLRYHQLFRNLLPLMAEDSILCIDGGAVYAAFASRAHIKYEVLLPGARVRGPYHMQNVNRNHGLLKQWMTKFYGVATHHLPKYLAWFSLRERRSEHYSADDHLIAELGIT